MTTPSRFKLVGDWLYQARGKVLDVNTNEEFDGLLSFTGNVGIETTEVDGKSKAELHTELVEDESRIGLWDLVVHDQPKEVEQVNFKQKLIKEVNELADNLPSIRESENFYNYLKALNAIENILRMLKQ